MLPLDNMRGIAYTEQQEWRVQSDLLIAEKVKKLLLLAGSLGKVSSKHIEWCRQANQKGGLVDDLRRTAW
eukprot:scaffold24496_cov80-Skeletonema_marinoi.AAC.3